MGNWGKTTSNNQNRCQGRCKNGTQCRRLCYNSALCYQHNKQKLRQPVASTSSSSAIQRPIMPPTFEPIMPPVLPPPSIHEITPVISNNIPNIPNNIPNNIPTIHEQLVIQKTQKQSRFKKWFKCLFGGHSQPSQTVLYLDSNEECPICMEPLMLEPPLKCHHRVHQACINQMTRKMCPICRAPL